MEETRIIVKHYENSGMPKRTVSNTNRLIYDNGESLEEYVIILLKDDPIPQDDFLIVLGRLARHLQDNLCMKLERYLNSNLTRDESNLLLFYSGILEKILLRTMTEDEYEGYYEGKKPIYENGTEAVYLDETYFD